jgi:hypothetical protein
MPRSFRPAVVVTSAAGLVACTGVAQRITDGESPPISHNPPAMREVHAVFPKAPFVDGQSLEAHDPEAGEIYHGNGSCWIYLPFDPPQGSWQPPPTEAVVCPREILADPAFTACNYGSIRLTTVSPPDCTCYFNGNPPPAPQDVDCPTTTYPELAATNADHATPVRTTNPPPPPPNGSTPPTP